jgi:hypothetical protein
MSAFDLSAFAPARPVDPADRLRKEWADLMDQLLIEALTMPDDDDLEEEKRHWMTRWESLTVSFSESGLWGTQMELIGG